MSKKKTTKKFIEESLLIHDNLYNYSKVKYVNNKTKVEIICKKHGSFFQEPSSHLIGKGCNECAKLYKRKLFVNNDFVIKANIVHDNLYNYSKVKYVNNKTKVEIICKIHGSFFQRPDSHLQNHGCPICKSSKGEKQIADYLNKQNIKYVNEKTFKGLKYKGSLRYDFYLPDYNTLIEFDGIQHFKQIPFFEDLKTLQIKDGIKTNFAKEKDIKLYRIKYTEIESIESIMESII